MKRSNVEKEIFNGGDECLLSSLDLKLKDEDITNWTDYKKIEALSNLINATKKNLSNIDLTMVVKLRKTTKKLWKQDLKVDEWARESNL